MREGGDLKESCHASSASTHARALTCCVSVYPTGSHARWSPLGTVLPWLPSALCSRQFLISFSNFANRVWRRSLDHDFYGPLDWIVVYSSSRSISETEIDISAYIHWPKAAGCGWVFIYLFFHHFKVFFFIGRQNRLIDFSFFPLLFFHFPCFFPFNFRLFVCLDLCYRRIYFVRLFGRDMAVKWYNHLADRIAE